MKHDLALWTGLLAGPLVWLLSFGARWSLSGAVCAFQWKPALFVIAFVALLMTAGTDWPWPLTPRAPPMSVSSW